MEIPLLYFIFLFLAAVLLFIISLLNISIIALPDDYIEEKIKEGDFRYFIIKRSIQNPLRFQNANNISTFIKAINKHKPAAAKGRYIKSAALSLTMSPSVKLETQELLDMK